MTNASHSYFVPFADRFPGLFHLSGSVLAGLTVAAVFFAALLASWFLSR